MEKQGFKLLKTLDFTHTKSGIILLRHDLRFSTDMLSFFFLDEILERLNKILIMMNQNLPYFFHIVISFFILC